MTPEKRAAYMWRLVDGRPDVMVPWYLMCSWLYYHLDISILPDADYDELCIQLQKTLPTLTHRHKHLVEAESLAAGTGYAIREYPQIVMSAGARIALEDKHLKFDRKRRLLVPRT